MWGKSVLVVGVLISSGVGVAQVSEDGAVAAARAFAADNWPAGCGTEELLPDGNREEVYPLSASEPEAGYLVLFLCRAGMYNVITTSVLVDADGRASALLLPTPQLEVTYVDGDTMGAVESIGLAAIVLSPEAVNVMYDPVTGVLSAVDKWRGIGDAFTSAAWQFQDGHFTLTHFAVDATYDGEIAPQTLIGH